MTRSIYGQAALLAPSTVSAWVVYRMYRYSNVYVYCSIEAARTCSCSVCAMVYLHAMHEFKNRLWCPYHWTDLYMPNWMFSVLLCRFHGMKSMQRGARQCCYYIPWLCVWVFPFKGSGIMCCICRSNTYEECVLLKSKWNEYSVMNVFRD